MSKKFVIFLPLIVMVIVTGLVVRTPSTDVNAQVIFTIVFPTATRTPTPKILGNFIWDDIDADGRQDAGEPGLSGITVQLWNSTKTQLIDSTSTDGSGIYSLVAPVEGSYRVRVVLPSLGSSFSPMDQAGGSDNLDSDINPTGSNSGFTDVLNIASNIVSISNIDAGILIFRSPTPTRTQTPIIIGNFVWHDLNTNGIQDLNEPGVAGVTVQLWSSDKTNMLDSTTTNASGNYTVIAPIPGDYRVRVVPFPGASFTSKDQGLDDTKDSDINSSIFSNNYGFTDIFTIASNVISITLFDAGFTTVGATPTPTPTVSPTPGVVYPNKIYLPLLSKN